MKNTEIFQALRDLVSAVEIAEDNNFSESSRRLLAAAAERGAETVYLTRMAHMGAHTAEFQFYEGERA